MKPIKMIMSAFGPYADQVEIAFDKFGESGLFLVTGDTGAGKTTIFDAICFALFGENSGTTREGSMMRSDFAKPDTKTFVSLQFIYKGKHYTVERNPSYERPKLRSEGLTKELANASLICPDGRVVTGVAAVTAEIESILGINKNQFSQIAMIAQGDFLRLLLANNAERSAIFRKVFGTDLYERFQNELKQQTNQLKTEYDTHVRSIVQISSGIECDESSENFMVLTDLKANKSIHDYDAFTKLLSTIIETDKNQYKLTDDELELLRKGMEELLLKIEKTKVDNEKLATLQKVEQAVQALLLLEDEIKIKETTVIEAEKALHHVKPVVDRMNSADEKVQETLARIEKLKADIDRKTLETKALETLFNEAKDKEPERQKLHIEIKRIEEDFSKYESLMQVKRELEKLTNEKNRLLNAIEKNNHTKSTMEQEKIVLQSENERLVTADKDLSEKKHALERESVVKESLQRLEVKNLKIMDLKSQHQALQSKFENINKIYLQKLDQYRDLEQLYFNEQAGILAEQLKENEPCQVCGSTVHPKLATKSKDAPTRSELDEAKNVLESENEKVHQTTTEISKIASVLETLQSDFENEAVAMFGQDQVDKLVAQIETEKLSNFKKVENLTQQISLLETQVLRFNQNKEQVAKLTSEVETLSATILNEEATLNKMNIDLAGLTTQIKTMESTLKYSTLEEAKKERDLKEATLKASIDDYEKTERRFNDSKSSLDKDKAASEELEKSKASEMKALDELHRLCNETLVSNDFGTLADYQSKLMNENSIKNLKVEITNYHEQLKEKNAEQKRLKQETRDIHYLETSFLEDDMTMLKDKRSHFEKLKMALNSRITANLRIEKELTKEKREMEKVESNYLIHKNLSETANGDLLGKQKLAFERYIQAFYFARVLTEANKRFSYMTSGRFELIRKETAGDMRSQTGLEIDVLDNYTGKMRSVKSLSGGESFKASLALALGLSDLIQTHAGGVQMDTMFVDEGFGSLDSESLEQAIEVLNALTHSNRLVGIISHVSELKERIDRKIIVKKGITGSEIELV